MVGTFAKGINNAELSTPAEKLERGDVDSVLDGDIDDFIKEYLLSRRAA